MAKTSKAWLHRHVNDPYVQRSVKEGYRSRAAYKLKEIDQRDRLLKPGMVVVDLGAAPGGWTQVATEKVGKTGRVIGIDLLPVAPVPLATLLQADFNSDAGRAAVAAALGEARVDLVLSDMAPNMTGMRLTDQARHFELAEAALEFALEFLKPDGALLVKTFQGGGFQEYITELRRHFNKVASRKPAASRSESAEFFLLAQQLKG